MSEDTCFCAFLSISSSPRATLNNPASGSVFPKGKDWPCSKQHILYMMHALAVCHPATCFSYIMETQHWAWPCAILTHRGNMKHLETFAHAKIFQQSHIGAQYGCICTACHCTAVFHFLFLISVHKPSHLLSSLRSRSKATGDLSSNDEDSILSFPYTSAQNHPRYAYSGLVSGRDVHLRKWCL